MQNVAAHLSTKTSEHHPILTLLQWLSVKFKIFLKAVLFLILSMVRAPPSHTPNLNYVPILGCSKSVGLAVWLIHNKIL